jgi:hypothetical protein
MVKQPTAAKDKNRPLTKREKAILKTEQRRQRLIQERESAEIGLVFTESMTTIRKNGTMERRRESFSLDRDLE